MITNEQWCQQYDWQVYPPEPAWSQPMGYPPSVIDMGPIPFVERLREHLVRHWANANVTYRQRMVRWLDAAIADAVRTDGHVVEKETG